MKSSSAVPQPVVPPGRKNWRNEPQPPSLARYRVTATLIPETSRMLLLRYPHCPAPKIRCRHQPDHHCEKALRDRRDRKSTRLNSSHLVISYAVFCLKKKKITDT